MHCCGHSIISIKQRSCVGVVGTFTYVNVVPGYDVEQCVSGSSTQPSSTSCGHGTVLQRLINCETFF